MELTPTSSACLMNVLVMEFNLKENGIMAENRKFRFDYQLGLKKFTEYVYSFKAGQRKALELQGKGYWPIESCEVICTHNGVDITK